MKDFLLTLVIATVLIASVVFSLSITWLAAERNISKDCEKLGTFYLGDKVYKCEVVK
jgi:hypothetical protein